jgi:acetyltransferase-like isoleucine patch superfamily enzyme
MNELATHFRYDLPLWLASLMTSWLPDNRLTIRARGSLYRPIIGRCGVGFTVGRDVTILAMDRLSIGRHCYFAKGTWINAMGGVEIEDEVVMSPYVVIASSSHGFRDGSVRFGGAHPAPVRIGRGSWLASHVVISAGVSVGRGNLVAANAVVTKDTPDDVIVGGVPARVLGPREDNPSELMHRRQFSQTASL